jgi:ornithine cyclodeaminase/alanine dehydrogenase-like protein (mu-crystallin family)
VSGIVLLSEASAGQLVAVLDAGALTARRTGADGSGKAEIAVDELLRARVVCDDWEQASHSGDIARAAESGRLRREDVAELGRILAGDERGRRSDDEITVFDSTGLAVQDLAVALTVYERYEREPGTEVFADVVQMEVG